MLVELRPDRSFERGERLAQLGLDLGDLDLHLEQLAPGAEQAQEINAGIAGRVIAGRELEHVFGSWQIVPLQERENVLLNPGLHEEILDITMGLVSLCFEELAIGGSSGLGFQNSRGEFLVVDGQIEADEQTDVDVTDKIERVFILIRRS